MDVSIVFCVYSDCFHAEKNDVNQNSTQICLKHAPECTGLDLLLLLLLGGVKFERALGGGGGLCSANKQKLPGREWYIKLSHKILVYKEKSTTTDQVLIALSQGNFGH